RRRPLPRLFPLPQVAPPTPVLRDRQARGLATLPLAVPRLQRCLGARRCPPDRVLGAAAGATDAARVRPAPVRRSGLDRVGRHAGATLWGCADGFRRGTAVPRADRRQPVAPPPAVVGGRLQALIFLLPHGLILLVAPEVWGLLPLVLAGALLFGWVR